jgi:enterochelin esterase-like enzyme
MKIPRLPAVIQCIGPAFTGFLFLCAAASGRPPPINSHEVNADHSVTFRYFGPTAQTVALTLDYNHSALSLIKGGDGVWTVTTQPLQAAVHMYSITVDGVSILDPLNPLQDPNLIYLTNEVNVPGTVKEPWEDAGAPRGVLHHHAYHSNAMVNLPDGLEDYWVYTPPGYDPMGKIAYPVLYLLHGWSAIAESWVKSGQANLILDNLIAQNRAVPMVVVMPLCYGDFNFVAKGMPQGDMEAPLTRNLELFSNALIGEIIPQIEAEYRVAKNSNKRAITGLSMGGGESVLIGLNHPDTFAWVGGFSSALDYRQFDGLIAPRDSGRRVNLTLLWIACGTGDDLIDPNRKFIAWLKGKGVETVAVETPGIHNWPVWRDNLVNFASLLFRNSPGSE